jgi:hypothetical protein
MKPSIRFFWVIVTTILTLFIVDSAAKQPRYQGAQRRVLAPGARPFDSVNIFDDWGKSTQLPNTFQNKLWWERMIRGEVGKDRFLILCALKNGTWKKLVNIRNFVEFGMRKSYAVPKLERLLALMQGRPNAPHGNKYVRKPQSGEGWLEKNQDASNEGLETEWRITPSVYPLLYFLLMACPVENQCR